MMRHNSILYRCKAAGGAPVPGGIVMSLYEYSTVAYRVVDVRKAKGKPALGMTTCRLFVERIPAKEGRAEVAAGAPFWPIAKRRR